MSNVLIGIIGVILFIGLALAGALFLGPRFQESRNLSIASADMQVMQQIANATNLYATNENGTIPDNVAVSASSDLVIKGYLKAAPVNPDGSGGGSYIAPYTSNGRQYIRIYYQSKAVCDAFRKQADPTDTGAVLTYLDPARQVGCFYSTAFGGGYAVYLAI